MDAKLISRLRGYADDKLYELLLHPEAHRPEQVDAAYIVAVERGIQRKILSHISEVEERHESESRSFPSFEIKPLHNTRNYLSMTPGSLVQLRFEELLVQKGIYFHRQDLSAPIVRYFFHDDDMSAANSLYASLTHQKKSTDQPFLQKIDTEAPQWIARVGVATVMMFFFVLVLTLFFE